MYKTSAYFIMIDYVHLGLVINKDDWDFLHINRVETKVSLLDIKLSKL